MHTKKHEPVDPNAKYEKSDISLKALVPAVIGFFMFTIAMYPLTYVFSRVIGVDVSPLYLGNADKHPMRPQDYQSRRLPEAPNPILQDNTTALTDMHVLRQEERARRDAKEGVDPKTNKKAIPLDAAIEMEARNR